MEIEPAVPVELTSQQAADLLNVSRPHVVKLARTGELPHRMVGNRHRFDLEDVLEYERRQREVRDRALAAIVPEDGYTAEDF
nr:helix-turn-helix domain-containing protein [Jiangella mangrovi]